MDSAPVLVGLVCLKLMKWKPTKVVPASIWITQRLAKRHVKAWFDLAWVATFVKEACEQLQHKICVDSLANLY
jgi:hypothetical protein